MDGCRAIFSQTWITDPPIGLYFPFLKDAPNAQLSTRNDGQEDLRRRKAKELPQYFRKSFQQEYSVYADVTARSLTARLPWVPSL